MTDFYQGSDSVQASARRMFLITPHAANEISPLPKAIRADTSGTVTLRAVDSTVDVVVTLAAGEILAVRAQYVRATGTTVTTLHGFS